jgi:MarR family transcriptional regulator, 2-MHQ and catechol-resistance regulon repressor
MTPTTATRRTTSQERALKLFVVLQRCASAVMGNFQEHADLYDLTLTEFEILEALYHKGPLLLGDVQRKILLSSGGVTYAIDRLADKGLVERRECATDRRARYAALTPKGEGVVSRIFPAIASHIEATMSVLNGRQQDEAIDLLRKLGLGAAGT